jgi:hypothetical protein
MWLAKIALQRPYTFVVLALLILLLGVFTTLRIPIDILRGGPPSPSLDARGRRKDSERKCRRYLAAAVFRTAAANTITISLDPVSHSRCSLLA